MSIGYIPSALAAGHFFRRMDLEAEVQNFVGPIAGIQHLSAAELYGIRDGIRRRRGTLIDFAAAKAEKEGKS